MLSREQRADLDHLGIIRLPAFLSRDAVGEMAGQLWRHLAEHDAIRREDPSTWLRTRPSSFQPLVRSNAFAALAGPKTRMLLDGLFGPGGWEPPRNWGQPLVCLPSRSDEWDLPRRNWHLDIPAGRACREIPGVRLFAMLEAVEPRGGGTVVVTGSHRLTRLLAAESSDGERLRSARMRRAMMRSSSWVRELFTGEPGPGRVERFMAAPSTESGVELQVVELTGEPGDLVVMDLRMLHAPAPNRGPRPRVVLGQAILRSRAGAAR
jgi:hypothetical protein